MSIDALSSAFIDGEMDIVQYELFESLEYGDAFKTVLNQYEYYDLMLINAAGDIVYSVKKEAELGLNVNDKTFENRELASVFTQGLDALTITDFDFYAPSQNKVMALITAPVKPL